MPLIHSKSDPAFKENEILAYTAGLFDGEGCINFTKSGQSKSLVIRAVIVNTNREVLEFVKRHFGGSIYMQPRSNSAWKQAYKLVWVNHHAVDFLTKINPWLIIKSDQVTIAWSWRFLREEAKTIGGANDEIKENYRLLERQLAWLNKKGMHSDPEPYAEILKGTEYALN